MRPININEEVVHHLSSDDPYFGTYENIRMEPRRPPVDPDATIEAQISLAQYVRMGGQIKEDQLVWSPVGGVGIYKLKQVINDTAIVEDVTGKTAFMAVEWFMIVVRLPITTIASAEPAFHKPTRAFNHNAGKR
ncbi:hypothetical protein ACAW74_25615 [Fibrella sp. WM1]|uniref:hypothetical protein n=1 Tax=Fibrella musci TaxID=3242485 RepID=UPI0035217775